MRKPDELNRPNSCLNRAGADEMLFVLRGHDLVAPDTIRFWASQRVLRGKNNISDPQIVEALQCAATMEEEAAR